MSRELDPFGARPSPPPARVGECCERCGRTGEVQPYTRSDGGTRRLCHYCGRDFMGVSS